MRQTEERYISFLDKSTHRVFNDKLTFKYVEISKFDKPFDKLDTDFDKWLYIFRNLSRLDRQPQHLQNKVFNRLFEEAEIAKFTKAELREYEDSLKAYRDIKNSLDTAEEKGRAEGRVEGRAEGRAEVAKKLLSMGMLPSDIAEATGLTLDEISAL